MGFQIENGVLKKYIEEPGVTKVVIPESVTQIGYCAFFRCALLTSVTISENVKRIGGAAFSCCKSLTDLTIPEGMMTIGNTAFGGCTSLTSVTIPESVTQIGYNAFSGCTSLTSINIPEDITQIGYGAFDETPWLENYLNDFVIFGKGILHKYKGKEINVVIPDSVRSIGDFAFSGCSSLATVTIPDSVMSIGGFAFSECKNLQYIQSSSELSIIEILHSGNPLVIEKSGENYRFFAVSYKNNDSSYDDFIKKNLWNAYDMELLNNGPKFKYRLPARLFGGLDRLLNPVDLTEENRQLYIELLKKNIKKMVAFAEEINCPFAVKALFDLGIVDDSNAKAVKKLITASKAPEIAVLSELFSREVDKTMALKKYAPKQTEPEVSVDPLTAEYRAKFAAIKGNEIIQKMKLIGANFPKVKLLDGTDASDELFRFIVASYGASDSFCINEEADKAAALLLYDSLCDAIAAVSSGLDFILYPSILPVVCRFGNPDQIKAVIKYYDTLKGSKGKKLQNKIKSALAMSDTHVAVLWLEKQESLENFARLRNISVEQVYDKYLYDFGFDEQGKRIFDLGTTTIEATISPELTLSLFNTATGKAVRSIPKKGVSPDVQKKAADELADMRATLKKCAKLKNNQLYQDYIEATEFHADEWKDRYLKNTFLFTVASLLVWTQNEKTFTLSGNKAIDSEGREYEIIDKPIKLAHNMEKDKTGITAWQKYFTDNKLKQPFIQVWEPVIDEAFVSENRYKDCPIRDFYLKKQEKRGISINWYSGYYSESHYLSIEGFDLDCNSVMVDGNDMVDITSIKPKKWNRRANMVISFLDRITIYSRILKDDPSIGTLLDSFTLPQILSFIDFAAKNECVNATAVLLNYRNENFPEYDGFAALDDLLLDDF